jgi:hypothetical protein
VNLGPLDSGWDTIESNPVFTEVLASFRREGVAENASDLDNCCSTNTARKGSNIHIENIVRDDLSHIWSTSTPVRQPHTTDNSGLQSRGATSILQDKQMEVSVRPFSPISIE